MSWSRTWRCWFACKALGFPMGHQRRYWVSGRHLKQPRAWVHVPVCACLHTRVSADAVYVYVCTHWVIRTWSSDSVVLESMSTGHEGYNVQCWHWDRIVCSVQRGFCYPPGLGHAIPALVLGGAAWRGQLAAEGCRQLDPVLLHLPQLAGQIRHLGHTEC